MEPSDEVDFMTSTDEMNSSFEGLSLCSCAHFPNQLIFVFALHVFTCCPCLVFLSLYSSGSKELWLPQTFNGRRDLTPNLDIDNAFSKSGREANVSPVDGMGICEGWLWKEGFYNKTYNRRFFRLKGHHLTYFETDESENLKGNVNLQGMVVTDAARGLLTNGFQLIPHRKGRVYRMKADNVEEKNKWVEGIRKVPPLPFPKT